MKLLPVTLLALALLAPEAKAQISLNVGDCYAGPRLHSVTNVCTTNTGTAFSAVVSIVMPPVTRVGFIGSEAFIDVQSAATSVPDWWRADACRSSGFVLQSDAGIGGSCPTLWDQVAPAGNYIGGTLPGQPGRFRLYCAAVLVATDAYDLTGDGVTEQSVFRVDVKQNRTQGTNACGGCATAACLILEEVNLQTLNDTPSTVLRLTSPINGDYGALLIAYNGFVAPCFQAVPARNRTWGAVKALYR